MLFRVSIILLLFFYKSYSQDKKQAEQIKDSLLITKSFIGDKIQELKSSIRIIDIKIDSINEIIELEILKEKAIVTSIRKASSLYSIASKYSSNLGELYKKQKVYVLNYYEYGNYFKVIVNNKIGYVYEKNLVINKAMKYLKKKNKYKLSYLRTNRSSTYRTYYRGPRGGCYYINSNGNKTYVARNLCN